MWVVLWTDGLVWLLCAAWLLYVGYCLFDAHRRTPWRRVFSQRSAVIAAVVLLAFALIGLLDSLHYRAQLSTTSAEQRYSGEVRSALDWLLPHLRERNEKTYSAPLATHSFMRETIDHADGGVRRVFVRLRYGGAHLADPSHVWTDVVQRAGAGLIVAILGWCVVGLYVRTWYARMPQIKLRTAWWTIGVLSAGCVPVLFLSTHYHVFGTDKVGQDVLYLALKSVRTSLAIGTLATLVMLPLGVVLGMMAGYFRGWVDDLIQYLYTTLNSIPGVLLIAATVLMMQVYIDTHPNLFPTAAQRADLRLLFLCLILGLTNWTGLARLLRGETLKLSTLDYIQAAHAFGVSHPRILLRHLLPNVMHLVIISLVMDFSGLVLAEAVLSYVGVGVDPSTTSFGTMINAARLEMAREPMVWWPLATVFIAMFVLVLSANLFADAVRDGFDPRLRHVPSD